jgi:spore coat protein CotH
MTARVRGVAGAVALLMVSLVAVDPSAAGAFASSASSPAPVARKVDKSNRLFDPSFVHQISFEVAPRDVGTLGAASDERVPAKVTVDGVSRDLAGLRLKHGTASFRGLDQKAGFSVKLDEYVKKQSVFGVERFTLGNEVWDPSFVSEHVTYEVFRRAGIPAPRTVLASVTLNGERFGLYVLREAYDKRFLERHFSDPNGNLYESDAGSDVSDTRLQPRTNEKTNDMADVKALGRIVAETPDDGYEQALGKAVDLRELFTYWAAEALTAHFDGYLSVTNVPFGNTDPSIVMGNATTNNFFTYRDPASGKFVVLPWGADWSLGNWLWLVSLVGGNTDTRYLDAEYLGGALARTLCEPKSGATMVARLARLPGTKERLRDSILAVLDRAWDVRALLARADQIANLVRADGLSGSREEVTLESFEREYALRRQFIESRPDTVRAELGAAGG